MDRYGPQGPQTLQFLSEIADHSYACFRCAVTGCIQKMIRFPNSHFAKEYIVQLVVIVLSGVDQHMIHIPIQLGNDPAQSLMISGRVPTIVIILRFIRFTPTDKYRTRITYALFARNCCYCVSFLILKT
jgi:hypothetical protein